MTEVKGLRVLGLGGSMSYRKGNNLYSEQQMARRVRRLSRNIKRKGGFDILLTHAPASGLGDLATASHRGYECFKELLDLWEPKFMIHGHIHLRYGMNIPRKIQYGNTTIINACGYQIIDI